MRGASNAIFSLKPEERLNGFATHSSGNHAQAVAYACKTAGVSAYIVMPRNAPKVKIDAVKNYGGNIVFCEPKVRISVEQDDWHCASRDLEKFSSCQFAELNFEKCCIDFELPLGRIFADDQ